ncbi:Deoxyribodipyrimidine photo-lyase [Oscillochloris trichoides DG-6]|uniref:Deoxyribodipyrimidine photo-lyase n=1 Tax=Oscillochloris trichoides DG-6 TaxID=765420 RepID=E1IDY7_9CHLR|nr:deoxyribodipyrimidine photo-lyase [Oscillochloris trichoides]EFO80598.1 Deoxyribodipyrimidine photo-lyase [Oscillochloris trichoides DG-6]
MIIHWFRRDLRLSDNPALSAAALASGGHVLPVYILDPTLLNGLWASPARSAFLIAGLRALDAQLQHHGLRLIVRHGEPVATLLHLVAETGASAVTWNRDYSPYSRRRDQAIEAALHAAGCAVQHTHDVAICPPDQILTKNATPYSVYTPYARQWRTWLAHADLRPVAAPILQPCRDLPVSHAIPDLLAPHPLPPAGELAAQTILDEFTRTSLRTYATQRDLPAVPGTSRLSPYLRFGMIAVRQCLAVAQAHPGPGADTWIAELAWRDFYIQVLFHHPHVLRGAFKPQYDDLAWENDPDLFAAWCAGHTGYPMVDAAMRQLQQEGWMHNRARMIVASFLTKDLLIDWRWGERYFMQMLLDGDPAANNGGWQWAASTGTDAQPYFRIFNPTCQGQKFDPHGDYIRRYLPELAGVPNHKIHTPHLLSASEQMRAGVRIGHDYPAPLVDHAQRRERALGIYRR